MNIVLLEPEIPYNTGNIGRSCVLTNTNLHLIKPLGFSIDDKHIKRAGLDYWKNVKLSIHDSLDELIAKYPNSNFYFATTKTEQKYCDVKYNSNDFIVFGKESKGIPEDILEKNKNNCITVPMLPIGRSLNLSNTAAIILYEALRQNNFNFGD
ncbi:tRNA (uridine(34)/cytosine(34)/5-carboxymethylaminomethyluridine(34)-2'-O)-methyltransferase TrmL [Haliovirga abyssi]|uniref:Putative tRNA (cytidine(34)-2'-O)-methyltransferase n=1 Tax=Haliovirga abyssi TaxID=2996794 RepID=A0AAU9DYT0_9FUSO|nr:tRNA (uridine(34)/cytosine(34)/5-carboxymethylaminomethyluridine(34)-2'-O)-methyltransferase TrmL [Haliovirga abyssi]BDU50600.1 putative tRNA (cytidine(34)-2'-O)-methyltransferase [Haliovirga abyssi]